ncbi:hypothetical protein FB451DRAFT_1412394 [Mycena latifolia]|nr:hypothetical protein FB451DRAFT_1412394 [Mycena latifolia]
MASTSPTASPCDRTRVISTFSPRRIGTGGFPESDAADPRLRLALHCARRPSFLPPHATRARTAHRLVARSSINLSTRSRSGRI